MRANTGAVRSLLDRQINELQNIRNMIDTERWDDLKALFERARTARERYLTQIE